VREPVFNRFKTGFEEEARYWMDPWVLAYYPEQTAWETDQYLLQTRSRADFGFFFLGYLKKTDLGGRPRLRKLLIRLPSGLFRGVNWMPALHTIYGPFLKTGCKPVKNRFAQDHSMNRFETGFF